MWMLAVSNINVYNDLANDGTERRDKKEAQSVKFDTLLEKELDSSLAFDAYITI